MTTLTTIHSSQTASLSVLDTVRLQHSSTRWKLVYELDFHSSVKRFQAPKVMLKDAKGGGGGVFIM